MPASAGWNNFYVDSNPGPSPSAPHIPEDDPIDLADRLTAVLADPAVGRAMGAAGRRFVGERFGPEQARRTLRTALDL